MLKSRFLGGFHDPMQSGPKARFSFLSIQNSVHYGVPEKETYRLIYTFCGDAPQNIVEAQRRDCFEEFLYLYSFVSKTLCV